MSETGSDVFFQVQEPMKLVEKRIVPMAEDEGKAYFILCVTNKKITE